MLAFFLVAAQGPKIDPGAMALLEKNRDAMIALRGYRAQCVAKSIDPFVPPGRSAASYQFSVLTAAKPNRIRYEMWEAKDAKPIAAKPAAPPDFAIVSDGKKRWIQSRRSYFVDEDANPRTISTANEPWDGFYATAGTLYERVQAGRQRQDAVAVRRLGRERIDGALCDKVEVVLEQRRREATVKTRIVVFLRPDGLVRRQTVTTLRDGSAFVDAFDLLRIEKNPDLRRQSYAYHPPKGMKPLEAPKGAEATEHATLLANGTPAPDFVAKDKDGGEIRLSDLKGKVVVLDFWASWCAPCVASMPHTQSVADKLQKEGRPVVVLAVDDAEKVEAFRAWVAKNGAGYPALRFLYSPPDAKLSGGRYKVTGIPTQYVIDAAGVLRASFVGYGGPTDALEKAIRGALGAG